jgi:hypothetical protein
VRFVLARQHLQIGAAARFRAMDRRWCLLMETGRGSRERMKAWAQAHLRWAHAAERAYYEPPRVTAVANALELLRNVH